MPAPDQIHPSQKRERMPMETDEQYAERMKRLDAQDALIASFPVRKSVYPVGHNT